MQGVIAAGSAPTADAGAEVLAEGGNAVDAAVAACFATAVGEPTLTSLAGGGMMIHRDGATGQVTICDFFSDAPRMGLRDLKEPDFFAIDLDFGPTTQQFHIGAASAAVPGVIPGLCEALDKWGTKPLEQVVAPACRMLREGYLQGPYQGFAAKLLEPILTYTESGRKVFHVDGRMVAEGDLFRLPQLADTLEAMASRGWRAYYDEILVAAMLEQFGPERGGLLTKEDFDAYRVHFREPLALQYHKSRVLTPPPPAAGGPMIAMMLKLLGTRQLGTIARTSPRHAGLLACAMAVADESRPEGALALEGARFDHWLEHFVALCEAGRMPSAKAPGGPANTTHISVIDAKGDAAAVTFSYGEGNAHVIADTGIVMNNLMGEDDLFPQGFDFAPRGQRLPTMMSPTVLVDDEGGVTALGTGGANRIRTAIVQVLTNLHDHGLDPAAAVAASRLHFEAGVLNAEVFDWDDEGAALGELGATRFVPFPKPNMFFGGVHMVQRAGDGTLAGAGDPRRGGVLRVVG